MLFRHRAYGTDLMCCPSELYSFGTFRHTCSLTLCEATWHFSLWYCFSNRGFLLLWQRCCNAALASFICLTSLTRAKTEGKNGISCLISTLCVNCLISILEYSRIIDYSIIWMCIWCGLLQKLYKIKKSELLNSKVYSKV